MQALNVVLLPDTQTAQWIIATSEKIHTQYQSEFIVDGTIHHPHISLYQSEYPEEHLTNVKTALTELAQKFRPFATSLLRPSTMGPFLFCDAGKNLPIQKLHEAIITVLNPLRDPLYHTRLSHIDQMPAYFAENAKKYGYGLAKKQYHPHITLTAFKTPEEAERVQTTITVPPLYFTARAIYLTNIDHHGTCTGILAEFPLSG